MNDYSKHHEIVKAVAEFLPGYDYDAEGSRNDEGIFRVAYLVNPEKNTKIGFSEDWRGSGKMEIFGTYPEDDGKLMTAYYWGAMSFDDKEKGLDSIGVSSKKSPEQIAKDVHRRLLPVYEPLMVEVLKEKAKREEERAKLRAFVDHVTEITGAEPYKIDSDDITISPRSRFLGEDNGSMTIRALTSGSVYIKIDYTSRETALDILNAIKCGLVSK